MLQNRIMSESELDANLDFEQNQIALPKSQTALVCGIIALPFSLGIIGVILAIIAITNGSSAVKTYNENPAKYTEKSFKNANAGKICGIISLSIFVASIVIALSILSMN